MPSFSDKLTFPVLRPGLRSCPLLSSLHAPSPSLSAPSPCCERYSDSEWAREGVSDPWLRGEEERDGDSRNRRTAGWLSTAGSLLDDCWDTHQKWLLIYTIYQTKTITLICPECEYMEITSGSLDNPALA